MTAEHDAETRVGERTDDLGGIRPDPENPADEVTEADPDAQDHAKSE